MPFRWCGSLRSSTGPRAVPAGAFVPPADSTILEPETKGEEQEEDRHPFMLGVSLRA